MHSRLRTLWLTWTAIIAAALLALGVGVGMLASDAANKQAVPELEQTTQVIGQSLTREIERAIGYGIPVDSLVGVDDWFRGILQSNRMLAVLTLSDAGGKQLAEAASASSASPSSMHTTLATLATLHAKQSRMIDGIYVNTMPLRNRNGNIVGWLHVGSITPATGDAVWLWMLATIAVLTALASWAMRRLIRRRLAQPLAACREANASLALGELPQLQAQAVRDPATRLRAALAERIHAVRKGNAYLLLKIGEVRAAHFDPAIQQQLDELAEPFAVRQQQADAAEPAGGSATSRMPRASRRALIAACAALVVTVIGMTVLLQAVRQSDRERLVQAGEQSLRQAWQATLEQQQALLDSQLQGIVGEARFMALLISDDDPALDTELERLSTPQMALAVFRLDGSVRAASGQHDESTRLDTLTLEPLRQNVRLVQGIWQNAARSYQIGVARRVFLAPGQEIVIMAAQPLNFSLAQLTKRLQGATAVADLRGQPVSESDAALTALWNHGERRDRVISGSSVPVPAVLASVSLTAPSGHPLGTLLASLPSPYRAGFGAVVALIACALLVLIAVAALLYYLRNLFLPVEQTAAQLEELANGRTDIDARPEDDSAESHQLFGVVRRLAEKIDALETLRRSRERQGRRQARFIRLQMMQLASRLDEGARRGILALGFQNLVSRVGQQYQELDRLVAELREALRAKTQFIALQQELEIARKMQLSILPREFPPRNGLELHATMIPAKEIGGDFYDFFDIDEHRVAMVVADVSGKGVPAAFFMAISRTLLRAIAQFSDSPASCVARLNDLLAADNEEMMFVTLFYAIIDTRDGSVVYANAGHNPPCLMHADGRVEALPGTRGIALAVAEGFQFAEGLVTLAPGDGLFMFTDGITEASAPDDQLYGDARLMAVLADLRTLPVREIPDRMVALIKQYESGLAQADDITCLMARWRPA